MGAGRKNGAEKVRHVTLLDIAQAFECSVSTMSIVLAEAPLSQKIASETREKVRAMAQRLGYDPNAFGRSLRMQRSQTIGVLAYDLCDPYCMPIAAGIQAGLEPAEYLPLLSICRFCWMRAAGGAFSTAMRGLVRGGPAGAARLLSGGA